ncbi:MAG: hypothetical protein K5756_00425 [Clostridiales bacterium]|nr:hypothetical protein [Clostridiales bacterium]
MKKLINTLLIIFAVVGVAIIVITFVFAFSSSEKSLWGKWEYSQASDDTKIEFKSITVDEDNGSMTVELNDSTVLECKYSIPKKNTIRITKVGDEEKIIEYKYTVSDGTLTLTPVDSDGMTIEYTKVETKKVEETTN